MDDQNVRAALDVQEGVLLAGKQQPKPLPRPRINPLQQDEGSSISAPQRTDSSASRDITNASASSSIPQARLSIMRLPSSNLRMADVINKLLTENEKNRAAKSQVAAPQRAEQLSLAVPKKARKQSQQKRGSRSSPASVRKLSATSPFDSPSSPGSPGSSASSNLPLGLNSIPLENLQPRENYRIEDDTEEDDDDDEANESRSRKKVKHASNEPRGLFRVRAALPGLPSGPPRPVEEQNPDEYIARPKNDRERFLSSILKLYNGQGVRSALAATLGLPTQVLESDRLEGDEEGAEEAEEAPSSRGSRAASTDSVGPSTPRRKNKWYYRNASPASTGSMGSIASLVSSTTVLAQPATSMAALDHSAAIRPLPKRRRSNRLWDTLLGRSPEDSFHVQIHVADLRSRQTYLLKLCRALMQYGAPSHRLEEYLRAAATILQIEGSFLYLPGCMMVSFDDGATHTTQVKLVKTNQGVDLGRLKAVHKIYKEVVHDTIGVEDATPRLDEIMNRKPIYSCWVIVFVYGLTSAFVGPIAFGARPIDLPIAFLLGFLLGIMQIIFSPKSGLYSNVFEISAAMVTSFLARAFGSIRGGQIFCFSALAQSAIVLILPGYSVLCGSLELQSRHIIPGSIRMVYAIIYSIFLGYGITIGTSVYGSFDAHASSDITCKGTMPAWVPFMFVPPFTLCLIIINQGQWKDIPVMILVAILGYVTNHFTAIHFPSNAQVASTVGAFAIGVTANMYSRLRHGLAVAAILPAIFVQVPSDLAAGGTLVSGVTSANQITNQTINGTTTVSNATQAGAAEVDANTMVFNVGYSMIQISIAITVGLFFSALVIYPFGKKRSALFSF